MNKPFNINKSAVLTAPLKSDKCCRVSIPFRLDVSLIQPWTKIQPLSHSKPNFFADQSDFGFSAFKCGEAKTVTRSMNGRGKGQNSRPFSVNTRPIEKADISCSFWSVRDQTPLLNALPSTIGDSGPIPLGCSTFRSWLVTNKANGNSCKHSAHFGLLAYLPWVYRYSLNRYPRQPRSKRITTKVIVASVSVIWMVHSFACVKQLLVRVNSERLIAKSIRRSDQEPRNRRDDSSERCIGSQVVLTNFFSLLPWVNLCSN